MSHAVTKPIATSVLNFHKSKLHKKHSGFTLIELMIVVAIVGILAAIAIPWYGDYIKRSRLPEAFTTLDSYAVKLDQYYQDNGRYTTTLGSGVCGVAAPSSTYFGYASLCPTDSTYTLTATGKASQKMDDFEFRLKQDKTRTTEKFFNNVPTLKNCWMKSKGDVCPT